MTSKDTKIPAAEAAYAAPSNNDDEGDDFRGIQTDASFKDKYSQFLWAEETESSDEDVTTIEAASVPATRKKKGAKKKPLATDKEIDALVAEIERTSTANKTKKSKASPATCACAADFYKAEEHGGVEDISKEIDERDRQKEAKKDRKQQKKKETKEPVAKATIEQKTNDQVAEINISTATPTAIPEDETSAADVDEKKSSSKGKKNPKDSAHERMVNKIKNRQKRQEEEKKKAIKEDEQQQQERFEQEREQRWLEEQRLIEKRKDNEKKLSKKPKENGTSLTKGQRKKLTQACLQLEAAGVSVPIPQSKPSNAEQSVGSVKKRVVYVDRRKKIPTKDIVEPIPTSASTEMAKKEPSKKADYVKDDWEEDETIIDVDKAESIGGHMNTSSNDESSESDSDEDVSSDESNETSSSNGEDENNATLSSMERVRRRLQHRHDVYESRRSLDVLRAPVISVLGHVDVGKTKLLDNLRRTHVQKGEAGGITQQIGATNVPLETIQERTQMCRSLISRKGDYIVPGLLLIDTPGHESFKNLRSLGSSLCDLAILVVDITHGLEPQTIESIKLLIEKNIPFIIALNKIDRLYNWKTNNKTNVELLLQEQIPVTRNEFEKRCNEVIVQFAVQGLNAALYYKNPDPTDFVSMVPVSANTGDEMDSLLALIVERCQTVLAKRLSYTDELQANIMEVKFMDGFGTTIDVILVNGRLRVGDTIVLAGQEGPIVTQVRSLLLPESNRDIRVRNQYKNYEEVKAARGIKITAKDLEKATAGLPLFVARNEDEIDYFKNEIQTILKSALNSIKLKEDGVHVQAPTLGSLEALLEFLKTSHIPYASVNIGPVYRKDVIRTSMQLQRDARWAVILAFDVKIDNDAQDYANNVGVTIFQADIIFHLHDMFIAHRERCKIENQANSRHLAVFPCKLRVLPQYIFNSRDPIVCGVLVEDGFIKLGTPICVPSRDFIELGRVVSLEKNHKALDVARKGQEVCIKIEPISGEAPKAFGRHFDENDLLMSKISRETIDVVKADFRDDMQTDDWKLMVELKKIFNIF